MKDKTIDLWLALQDRKRELRLNGQRNTIKRLMRIYAKYAATELQKEKLRGVAAYCDRHAFIPESYMNWLEDLLHYCDKHRLRDKAGQFRTR